MSKIFFTSDHHFGHQNILKFEPVARPFDDLSHMHRVIIDNWFSTVSEEDTVYLVGDIAMGTFAETSLIVGQLPGQKILIPGNHDRVFPHAKGDPAKVAKKVEKNYQAYMDNMGLSEIIYDETLLDLDGKIAKVCHFPYLGEDSDSRYPEARPLPGTEDLLICGHVHGSWQTKMFGDKPMVNVGVDVWSMTPVSVEEVLDSAKVLC